MSSRQIATFRAVRIELNASASGCAADARTSTCSIEIQEFEGRRIAWIETLMDFTGENGDETRRTERFRGRKAASRAMVHASFDAMSLAGKHGIDRDNIIFPGCDLLEFYDTRIAPKAGQPVAA